MKFSSGAICISALLMAMSGSAVDLKKARFNQVVNDVKVLELATKKTKKASVDDVFNLPDVIRTGPGSRAELIAEDRTITRIGANSIFSFDPANRTISLEKGSILFQSPKGKGGGTIRTTSAAASVLGTTMIVAATDDGGFKVLLLEGSGSVTLPNGKKTVLKPGQMIFVLPNEEGFSPVISFLLGDQVEGSLLVNGFNNELPSMNLINQQITRQNKLIANGQAVDTGLLVGNNATPNGVQVIDANLLQGLLGQEVHHGPVDPGPIPNPGHGPIPGPVVPPILFDLIIGSFILDDEDLQYDSLIGHYMEGNNVLVDAETVDMSIAAGDPTFYIDAMNIMQFQDNPSHSTAFLGAGDFNFPTQALNFAQAEAGGVYELNLTAGDFIFPNEFTLTFDGYVLNLTDLNDMNLSSTSENGLRIETLTPEGSLELAATGNLNLSGNVRLYADGLNLFAGNNLTMNGGFLGFFYYADIQAGNRLTMRNVDFGESSSYINMSAKTIVLENILFPSGNFVYLESELGQLAANPNTGASVVPGMVNFIRDVYYGSTSNPAQNEVGINIFINSQNSEVPVGHR